MKLVIFFPSLNDWSSFFIPKYTEMNTNHYHLLHILFFNKPITIFLSLDAKPK